jgi:hypothetical protein
MSGELDNKASQYRKIAEQCIKQLLDEFTAMPSCFFSESDVKCRLFAMLFQHEQIRIPRRTIDGQLTSPLHTEVSYFDHNGKLLFHVDLSAVDPSFTNTFSNKGLGGVKLSKGYAAKICYFAIELKLNKLDSKPDMLKRWIADMDKLTDIRTRNPYLTCFSILFDKKANTLTKEEFEEISNNYRRIKILYANSDGEVCIDFRDRAGLID